MNIFSFKNINFSSVLTSTGNVLNVIKRTIPIYKELKPFFNKEKKIIEINNIKKESLEPSDYNDSLTFFQ